MIIVLDSSALVAALKQEPDAQNMVDCMGAASHRLMSTATFLECGIVVNGHLGQAGVTDFRTLIRMLEVELVPFDTVLAETALEAYVRFGKGSGHPANLNFGDCFSYALAKTRGLPLLFKGDDFIHTDVASALSPG